MRSPFFVLFCAAMLALACQKNAPTADTSLDEELGVMDEGEDPFDGEEEAIGEEEEEADVPSSEEEEDEEGGEEGGEEEEEGEADEDEF